MYRCDSCRQLQPAGTPSLLVPVQTRAVTYPICKDALPGLPQYSKRGRRIKHPLCRDDPGGVGHETVKELRCCPSCAARLRNT